VLTVSFSLIRTFNRLNTNLIPYSLYAILKLEGLVLLS
jgi:hypothetical protein